MSKQNPDIIYGLGKMAAAIAVAFNMPCNGPTIKHWQTLNPPFPSPEIAGANRHAYSKSKCFAWVEEHGRAKSANGEIDASLEARARSAILNIKIHQEESERLDLEEKRGNLIDKKIARNSILTFAKQYHALVRAEVERNTTTDRKEKLIAIGISPELVAIFHEWDLSRARETINKIEKECINSSKESCLIQ